MHVGAKKIAFLGLLLSMIVVLIILSGILEWNTLFLLAGASFGIGIGIRECGVRLGLGAYLAAIFLGFMLAPNKIYCITFAAFGFYIIAAEFMFELLEKKKGTYNRSIFLWVAKYIIFNIMYIGILVFLPKLIYSGEISNGLKAIYILAGQIGIFIFDRAYYYFQGSIWGKFRGRLFR